MIYRPNQREKERQRRGRVSPIRPYSGFPVNTQQFIQPQRPSGIPMGGSRTTTGPSQPVQEDPSLAGALESGIGAYKTGEEAFTGGENLRKAYENFNFTQDVQYPMEEMGVKVNNFFGGDARLSSEAANNQLYRMTGVDNPAFTQADPRAIPGWDTQLTTNNTGARAIEDGMSFVDGTSRIKGTTATGSPVSGLSQTGNLGFDTANVSSSASGGLGNLAPGLDAGSTGANAVGSTGAGVTGLSEGTAASSGSGSVAGKVGAGAGVAFNAYDMSQNGINAGNAMGLVGSGILLSVGAANAWNPVGWALLAGSAAYSLFG